MNLITMAFNVLKENEKEKFTSFELAKKIYKTYPNLPYIIKKRKNPRFRNDKEFISQLSAEIGARKDSLLINPVLNVLDKHQLDSRMVYFRLFY